MIEIDFSEYSNSDVIHAFSLVQKELKKRDLVRSKNIVGDLAETIAIETYNNTKGLTNLKRTQTGTANVDATGRNGARYSIKGTSGQVTGLFFGLPDSDGDFSESKFDYVVIVKFNYDYTVKTIAEITWKQFVEFKKWLPRQKAYNLNVSNKLLDKAKIIYPTDK